ncbi:hypothetical protein [Fructobacillus cardui]|uniref:hypothetical protein n=1 Tax=Fructobacillus cardui TaxID=2893170 RepID=UPI00200B6D9D|nr:hypothetical protein [Fructobacillus cardui]MCK8627298.1 hypothetical protein [Fructobacillus cardui]
MFIIFGLIFYATFVYLLVKRAQRKQFGTTMKNKNKYILIGACILSGILFVISLSSSDDSDDYSNSSDRKSSSVKKTSSSKKETSVKSSSESSSSETKKSESSSSSSNETKKSESPSTSTNEGHQSAQTKQAPTQTQQAPTQTQQAPTQTQPTPSDDENTTVYVANNGKSLAYWYSASDMPANTNKSKVVAMTEAQAKQQGKHASLRE